MASAKKMMTFEVLNRMDTLISEAKTIPLYKRIMLEKEEFTSLMRRLQDSIPADLQDAKRIVEQEEAIISESNKELEQTERSLVLEQLFPEAVLKDYERYDFPIEQIKRLQRHPWSYKIMWFLERCLFKLEKRKLKKTSIIQSK